MVKRLLYGLILGLALGIRGIGAIYYIAPDGNDANNGASRATPWATFAGVRAHGLSAGDYVLFQRGGTYYTAGYLGYAGAPGAPITIGAYGVGAKPILIADYSGSDLNWVEAGYNGVWKLELGNASSNWHMGPVVGWLGNAAPVTELTPIDAAGYDLDDPDDFEAYCNSMTANSYGPTTACHMLLIKGSTAALPANIHLPCNIIVATEGGYDGKYYIFQDLDIRNAYYGLQFGSSHHNIVQRCAFIDIVRMAVYWRNNASWPDEAEGNVLRYCNIDGVGSTMVYAYGTKGTHIHHNTIANVEDTINGYDTSYATRQWDKCGIGLQECEDALVEWNTIANPYNSYVDYYFDVDSICRHNFGLGGPQSTSQVAGTSGSGCQSYGNVWDCGGGRGMSCGSSIQPYTYVPDAGETANEILIKAEVGNYGSAIQVVISAGTTKGYKFEIYIDAELTETFDDLILDNASDADYIETRLAWWRSYDSETGAGDRVGTDTIKVRHVGANDTLKTGTYALDQNTTPSDSYIYNNEFYDIGYSYAIYTTGNRAQYVSYLNNNFYLNGVSWVVYDSSGDGVMGGLDYNNYYVASGSPQWKWAGTNYATLAAFASASGCDTHSIQVDPAYASSPPAAKDDFKTSQAALRDAGVDLTAAPYNLADYRDAWGNYVRDCDIGAYSPPAPTHYWAGGTSTDPADLNNWSDTDGGPSPASKPIDAASYLKFTGNGDGNACTFTAALTIDRLDIDSGYTSKIDTAGYDLTLHTGVLAGGGEFDPDASTITLAGMGTLWDNSSQATYTRATHELQFDGVGEFKAQSGRHVDQFTVTSGSYATLSNGYFYAYTTFAMGADANVTTDGTITYGCLDGSMTLGDRCRVGGYLIQFSACGTGDGITSRGSGVVFEPSYFYLKDIPNGESIGFPAGDYDAYLKITNYQAVASTFAFPAGTTVLQSIELENAHASGSMTIDNSANDPDLELTNSLIRDEQAGTCTWIPGTGTLVIFSGEDSALDLAGDTCDGLIIDKELGGDVTLSSGNYILAGDSTMSSLHVGGDTHFDANDHDITQHDNKNFIADSTGSYQCGAGTHAISNGDFDNKNQAAWDEETATLDWRGTGSITTAYANNLETLTIHDDSTVTIHTDTATALVVDTVLTIGDNVSLTGKPLYIGSNCEATIGDNFALSGGYYLYLSDCNSGKGIVSIGASPSITSTYGIWIYGGAADKAFPAANYACPLRFYGVSSETGSLTLAAGTYTFTDLWISHTGTGSTTFDGDTNSPTIHCTNLRIDNDSTATLTISGTIHASGNVVDEIVSGTVDLSALNLTLTGSSDQSIDLHDLTVGAVTVNSTGGTVTFTDGWTADSFSGVAGTVDFNSETFLTTGDFSIGSGCHVVAGADAWDGVDLTVGGDFSIAGSRGNLLNMQASATGYLLAITGTARADYVLVAHSDASGGTLVRAYEATDAGGNTNWRFVGGTYIFDPNRIDAPH